MKKILLSVAVILVTAFYANAQSYTLAMDGEVLGETITINPDSAGMTELAFEVIFNNTTATGANIRVIREEISMIEGASSYFCWGACYPPNVDTSGMTMFIPAGGSSAEGDFSAHYEMGESTGISVIKYTFVNLDNSDEFVSIVVSFDSSLSGVDENILQKVALSDIYPNPATNFVNIDYSFPTEVTNADVRIVNILGSVVKEQNINTQNNTLQLDISNMKSGIYFYSVLINNEVYNTKRLIIR